MARYVGTGVLVAKQSLYTQTAFTVWTMKGMSRNFDGRHTRLSFSDRVGIELREAPVRSLDVRTPRP